MKGSRIAALLIAVLMTASILYVVNGATAYDVELDEASIEESTVDDDGDGRINFLVISVPLDVVDVEWYDHTFIYAELRNSLGPEVIEVLNVSVSISSSFVGTMWVDLEFSGRTINASGIDGPYEVYIEQVYQTMPYPYPFFVEETYTHDTAAYSHDDFETPDPYDIEGASWWAVDDDANDLYDWLQVNVTVNATDGDIVTVTTEWYFECSNRIAVTMDERVLSVDDNQTVYVQIDGRILNASYRHDTQYYAVITVATSDGYADMMSTTSPEFYNATEFEPYVITIVGDIGWEPIDVNEDGEVDFLKVFYNVTVTTTDEYRIMMHVDDVNVSDTSADNFEGYLIEGYEETIVTFIEADELYENGMPGPYDITVIEDPTAFDKWPDYFLIEDIRLGVLTIESFDLDELNHPDILYVSGYIVDGEGVPLDDADVDVQSTDFTWLWRNEDYITTGVDGMYNFTEAIPGVLNIMVSKSGYFDESLTITDFDSNTTLLNITLEERDPENSTIMGTVFNAMDDPVPDTFVGLIKLGSGVCNETDSDSEGNYTVNVKEGDYLIVVFREDPTETMINITYAQVAVSANETVWLNLTLNETIDMPDELFMSGSMRIDFSDWGTLDMLWNIDLSSFGAAMFFELAYMADIQYGNADGYIDEDEARILVDIFEAEFMGDGFGAQSGLYSLEMFCVDGIGYYAPPAAIDFAVSDIIGPTWSVRDEVAIDVAFSGAEAYWNVPDEDSHIVYVDVDYVNTESDVVNMVLEVVAPTGYILTGTNDPANVTIEGLNHVTITPGGSPDHEDEYSSSVLVALTFSREAGEDTGSIHGTAVLEGETDYSGIEVELLYATNHTVLDSVVTDSTGEFAFLDLEPGSYNLRGSMAGYYNAYANVTVVAGEMAEAGQLTLLPEGTVLETGSIEGTVVTQAGLPIGSASIEIFSPSDNVTVLDSAETAANGTFEFLELDTGEYRLEISAYGFTNKTVYVLLNAGEARDIGEIELLSDNPVGYVTGILHDTDGSGIAGVTVEVRASGSDTVLGEDETDSMGVFLIDGLEDGDYNLTFILDGTVIGHADVTVVDFVGDAGIIVIDLASIDFSDDELPWIWILLILAIVAIVGVALAMKMRKPKASQPMKFEEPPTDTGPVEEELPPPPPEY